MVTWCWTLPPAALTNAVVCTCDSPRIYFQHSNRIEMRLTHRRCAQTCVDKLGQDGRFYRRYDSTTWHRRWTVASWAPCAAAEGRCAC